MTKQKQKQRPTNRKHKKVKRYYTRTIDLCFLLLLLIIAIFAFFTAFTFQVLPTSWLWIALLCFLCIFLMMFKSSLRKASRFIIYSKRIFIIILCFCLGTFGFLLSKSKTSIQKMNINSSSTTEIFIIAKANSTIHNLEDLNNKTIGFQNGVDANNATFVKEELDEQLSYYESYQQLDYTTLINDLLRDQIDALVISEPYFDMAKANVETLSQEVKTITSLKKHNDVDLKDQKNIAEETFTVYLSGIDNVGSPDQQTRTDTNLILIVNPIANHIDMISLPRDGYIPNPALHNANDKLTHTGLYGIDTSVKALEQFFQIPIDYYARVSFNSLIAIIDAIGGIDVDVEIDFCEQDENRSFKKDDLICLTKGQQHLNGKQALAYARHRKTAGYDNAGRERAQQRIIKAIINKLVSPKAVSYLNKLLDVAPNYIITNMPPSQISRFVASELKHLKPWTISSISSDNGVYDSQYTASLSSSYGPSDVYLFNKEEVQAVIDAYHGASQPMDLPSYSFNLTDAYRYSRFEGYNDNVIWDFMANYPH